MVHYSSVREIINGKFKVLLLEIKVCKTVLNNGYTTSGITYRSTFTLSTSSLFSPLHHPACSKNKIQNLHSHFISVFKLRAIKVHKKYIQVTSGRNDRLLDQEVPLIQDNSKGLAVSSTRLFITLLNIFIICF
jgi:hypothetical protein